MNTTAEVVLETVVEYGHSRRNISKLNRKWLVFAISKLGAKNNAEVKSTNLLFFIKYHISH